MAFMAENSEPEPAGRGPGRPFPKGVSGNPGGRPKKLQRIQAAIERRATSRQVLELLESLRQLGLAGDVRASKLWFDRVLGPLRTPTDEPCKACMVREMPDAVLDWLTKGDEHRGP